MTISPGSLAIQGILFPKVIISPKIERMMPIRMSIFPIVANPVIVSLNVVSVVLNHRYP